MRNYRNIFLILILAGVFTANTGCKKLLNVDPITAMSANNFWKTRDDVERFTAGAYLLLRNYTAMDGHTLLAIGDYRCTPWTPATINSTNISETFVHSNDMKSFINSSFSWGGTDNTF